MLDWNVAEITVLIVSHQHDKLLRELLTSINTQSYKPVVHLVLNKKESPKTMEFLNELDLDLKTIINPRPLGLAANLNLAMKHIDSPYCLVLNPDTVLPMGHLEQIRKLIEKNFPGIMSCPSFSFPENYLLQTLIDRRTVCEDAKRLVNLRELPGLMELLREVATGRSDRMAIQECLGTSPQSAWFQGSYLFAGTSLFRRVGFDERLPLYFEDVDFCERAQKSGIPLYYEKDLFYYHHFQGESRNIFSSAFLKHCLSALRYFIGV